MAADQWVNRRIGTFQPHRHHSRAPGSRGDLWNARRRYHDDRQIVVHVSQAVTVAQMNFDKGDGGYKIAGNFPVNVQREHQRHTRQPRHQRAGQRCWRSDLNVGTGSSLTIDNLGGGGYGLFEKDGGGTLIVDKMQNVSLNLLAGTLEFKPGNVQNNGWIFGSMSSTEPPSR